MIVTTTKHHLLKRRTTSITTTKLQKKKKKTNTNQESVHDIMVDWPATTNIQVKSAASWVCRFVALQTVIITNNINNDIVNNTACCYFPLQFPFFCEQTVKHTTHTDTLSSPFSPAQTNNNSNKKRARKKRIAVPEQQRWNDNWMNGWLVGWLAGCLVGRKEDRMHQAKPTNNIIHLAPPCLQDFCNSIHSSRQTNKLFSVCLTFIMAWSGVMAVAKGDNVGIDLFHVIIIYFTTALSVKHWEREGKNRFIRLTTVG